MNTDQREFSRNAQERAEPHNPDRLTPEQIGTQDGWRLLDRDEIDSNTPISWKGAEVRHKGHWIGPAYAHFSALTYRTKLTREELRKARGLEPEQPKPVTPESLAEEYAAAQKYVTEFIRARDKKGFLAGYRANADRNADLAQRLDLAEEALKRNGFELGVVKDVVTWVISDYAREQQGDHEAATYEKGVEQSRTGIQEVFLNESDESDLDGMIPACRIQWCEDKGDPSVGDYGSAAWQLAEDQGGTNFAALKTAAADYAKAAEASAATIERLTRERDWFKECEEKGKECFHELNTQALEWLNQRDTLQADLASTKAGRDAFFELWEESEAELAKARADNQRLRSVYEGKLDKAFGEITSRTQDQQRLETDIARLREEARTSFANGRKLAQAQWRDKVENAEAKIQEETLRADCNRQERDEAQRALGEVHKKLSAETGRRDDLRRQLAEAEALAEDGQKLGELVWANSMEGDDAYEVEDVLASHYRDRDEALATVEAMRKTIGSALAIESNLGASESFFPNMARSLKEWAYNAARPILSVPPSSHLRALKLEVAEAAYKEAVRWSFSPTLPENVREESIHSLWIASATHKALHPASGTEAGA